MRAPREPRADAAARADTANAPRVSVIVPCRNECAYIEAFVRSLLAQDYPGDRMEFLIADGSSTDGTTALLESLAGSDARIRVIENPRLTVSCGLNAAVARASGEVIVRMDVHTQYAADYVRQCVSSLVESGAQCVGGPWRAVGRTYWQRAIAAAFGSSVGSGGARSHLVAFEGEVDSVYLGCWWRADLVDAGLFDEDLVRNQDDELCLRLRRKGGRVWQSPRIRSEYTPRSSLHGLFRQYYQYGYWKVRVIQKHGESGALRHFVPVAAVTVGAVLAAVAPFVPVAAGVLAAVTGLYLLLTIGAAFVIGMRSGAWDLVPVLPAVFFAYHAGYGLGFARGVLDFAILRRGAAESAVRLTR